MTRSLCLAAFLVGLPVFAVADQYWVAYEGNDFPENDGWTRIHDPPGAERDVEGGVFSLDTRNDVWITDYYEMYRPGALDPEPGELFVYAWRLRVAELTHPFFDPSVGVYSDERRGLGFEFEEDGLFSAYEPGVSATFEPGEFHEFEVRSCDMLTYELYIDDELSIVGSFLGQMDRSRVVWGDGVQAIGSLSEWDYLRFGVVPEPTSVVLVVSFVCATLRSSIRRRAGGPSFAQRRVGARFVCAERQELGNVRRRLLSGAAQWLPPCTPGVVMQSEGSSEKGGAV